MKTIQLMVFSTFMWMTISAHAEETSMWINDPSVEVTVLQGTFLSNITGENAHMVTTDTVHPAPLMSNMWFKSPYKNEYEGEGGHTRINAMTLLLFQHYPCLKDKVRGDYGHILWTGLIECGQNGYRHFTVAEIHDMEIFIENLQSPQETSEPIQAETTIAESPMQPEPAAPPARPEPEPVSTPVVEAEVTPQQSSESGPTPVVEPELAGSAVALPRPRFAAVTRGDEIIRIIDTQPKSRIPQSELKALYEAQEKAKVEARKAEVEAAREADAHEAEMERLRREAEKRELSRQSEARTVGRSNRRMASDSRSESDIIRERLQDEWEIDPNQLSKNDLLYRSNVLVQKVTDQRKICGETLAKADAKILELEDDKLTLEMNLEQNLDDACR